MEDTSELRALSSGRVDPLHPGHIVNIIRMAQKYKSVKYIILNNKARRFPIDYCLQLLDEIFSVIPLKIEFIVNTVHFGEINRQELDSYGCDIYVGGNIQVLRHIELLGFPVHYIERAYEYTASDIPLPK